MAESESALLGGLKSTFGYGTFKSDLQRKAVSAVYEGEWSRSTDRISIVIL